MEKEKQELYQVEDFILQRDETVKKLGESNQSQQEPYTTATSGSDQRFRSQQPNIGNTLAQDLALIPNLDPEICRIAIKYPKLFETKLRPPPPRDFQYKIQLTDHTQIYSKPYKCNQEEQALIKDFINEKLEAGVLVPAQLMLGYTIFQSEKPMPTNPPPK